MTFCRARSSPGIESNREHVPMEVLNMKKLQESTGAYSSADETLVSQNSIRDSFIVPDQKPSCIETFFGHRRPNDDMKQDNSDSVSFLESFYKTYLILFEQFR